MADFVRLEDAAKLLNVTVEELKEMRSRGEVFGVRDGNSWKFKPDEIDRVRSEIAGDVLDDDPGGSSILVSERSVGAAGSKIGSTLSSGTGDSDLPLGAEDLEDSDEISLGSDVALVADPASGSGVRLVNKNAPIPLDDDDDEVLELPQDSAESGASILISDLNLEGLSDHGSSTPGSGISLDEAGSGKGALDSDVLSGMSASRSAAPSDAADLIRGDSDAGIGDEEGDLVLGSDSSLSLKGESGIDLMSPADSGISLEDEPLDLAGAGISGLGLGSDEMGSDPAASASGISGIDFAAAEDFQLSPSGGFDVEEDSGSQVIELEDSADLASASPDGFAGDDGVGGAVGFDDGEQVGFDSEQPVGAGVATVPDVTFGFLEVGFMLINIVLLGLAGILMTDISRNLWSSATGSNETINSWLSEGLSGMVPGSDKKP
jgi:hypothetical protein